MQYIPLSSSTAAYRRLYFTTVASTNLQTRVTGALTSPVARISINGAASAAATNSITEVDAANFPGLRYLELTAAEVGTLGQVTVRIAATGVEPRELVAMVTGLNPFDAVRAGLTALPNANATVVGGLPTVRAGSGDADLFITAGGHVASDVRDWSGAPVVAPNTTGVPRVDVRAMEANTLTATAMASNAITAAKIATDAITADKIATDAITEIQTGLATASSIANLEKVAIGRWKIVGTQLILYELDGTTPFKTFNLKDSSGAPSNTQIFERVPVP